MSSTSFSIKDDLKIAYWAEPEGVFILGQSILGGTDVLADSAKSWISLTDYVTSMELENGTQVDQGVLNYPKAGTCSISMIGNGLSTFVNKSLRAGTFVSVGLKPTDGPDERFNMVGNPKPNTFTGTNTLWYVSARGSGGSSTSTITGGYWVDTVTVAPSTNAYTWNVGSLTDPTNQGILDITPSTVYTASVYVTSSITDTRSLSIKWYDATGILISSSSASAVSLPANGEVRATITATAPAGAFYASMNLNTNGGSVIRTLGSTLKMRKALMDEGTSSLRTYFDGDTPIDFRYWAQWESGIADSGVSYTAMQMPTLFVGRIKTVDTIYPLEGPAQVNVSATDFLEDFMSYNVPLYDIPAYWGSAAPFDAQETIQTAFADYYDSAIVDGMSYYNFQTDNYALVANMQDLSDPVVLGMDNVSVSNIVNSALDCELGMMVMEYDNDFSGGPFYSILGLHSRNTIYGTQDAWLAFARRNYYSAGNTNSPDALVNDIQLYSTTNELANKVVASLAWDSAVTVTDKNQDAIDLYGELSTERSLNLWNLFALNLWAKALNEYTPVKYVRSVAGITATPNKAISAFAFMQPADLLTVQFSHNDLVLNEPYRIVNVAHSISVDEWNTTVELWKGN